MFIHRDSARAIANLNTHFVICRRVYARKDVIQRGGVACLKRRSKAAFCRCGIPFRGATRKRRDLATIEWRWGAGWGGSVGRNRRVRG